MIDFRKDSPARAVRYRADRRRVVYLIFILGLVVILAIRAANPDNWRWLAGGRAEVPGGQGPKIDNRIDLPSSEHPGEMLIAPAPPAEPRDERPPVAGDDEHYPPGVIPHYIDAIRDDTVFRTEEYDA